MKGKILWLSVIALLGVLLLSAACAAPARKRRPLKRLWPVRPVSPEGAPYMISGGR